MTAKKKRGGRVTPKGTANPAKKTPKTLQNPVEQKVTRHVPRQDAVEKGRAARPITHHRGNR